MKRRLYILLYFIAFIGLIYGCQSGGGTVFIYKYKTSEPEIVSKNEVIGDDGTLKEIVFPSGAAIKATEKQTFLSGVEVSVDEEKITESEISNVGTPLIYRLKAKLVPDNPLEAPIEVNTLSKPLTITIPNKVSDTGICYYGIRKDASEPWRYSRCKDSNIVSNFVPVRASAQKAPNEVTFQIYRANIEFALFVFNFSDGSNSFSTVDQAESETKEKIYTKVGFYAQDLKVSTVLKGFELNSVKSSDLAVKVTFNSDSENIDSFKANGIKYKLESESNEASTGGKYSYSFDVTGINFESQIDSEIKYDLVLNTKGVKTEDFPTTFLIEVYSITNDNSINSSLKKSLRLSEGDPEPDDGGGVMPFSYPQLMSVDPEEIIETYEIAYDLDGGEVEEENPTSYDIASETITLNNPTKDGYDFIGWTGSNGESPEITVTIPQGSEGDKSFTANYEPTGYSITCNLNDGVLEVDNPTAYNVESEAITLNNPTKEGYNFKGWSGTGFSGTRVTVTIPHGSTGNRTYTANYTPIQYTIAYDLNGGTVSPANKTKYDITSSTITLRNPTKTGYSFDGWTGSNGDTPSTSVTIPQGSTGNKNYTANYTRMEYSISYNLNDGTVDVDNPVGYNIDSENITLNNPTKEGYNFKGWSGTGLSGSSNTTVTITQGSTGNRTYTANYDPIQYTIAYTLNGGTVSSPNPSKYDITSATFSLNNPTKTGYDFVGWSGTDLTGNNNTSVSIARGSIGNRSYVAHLTPTEYTITYDLKDGLVDTPNPTIYTIESENITLNNPTKRGYNFKGWSGGGLAGTSNTEVTIVTGTTGNKTYTANYTKITYSISYELDGGTVSYPSNKTSYNVDTANFTLKNPTKTGYTFLGWSGTELDGIVETVTIPKGSIGDREYFANFVPTPYTITYHLNDGILETPNPESYDITSSTFSLNNPTKIGYDFKGWSGTGLPGDSNTLVYISEGSTGNKTFTANFTPITYHIEYALNGGTVVPSNPTTFTVTSADITLRNPSINYYDFIGWTGSNGDTPEITVTIPNGSIDDRSYIANFVPTSYTISYELDGGTATPENPTSYDITSSTITLNNPTKDYYNFDGWSGTDLIGDTNTIVRIPRGSYDNREYTAHYTPITYNITYDGIYDGVITPENPTTYNVTTSDFDLNNPVRRGYTFEGWSGTGLDGIVENVTVPRGSHDDREYTANYNLITYHINYELDEGEQPEPANPTYYDVASDTITLREPTKVGYEFVGWSGTGLVGEDNMVVSFSPADLDCPLVDRTYTAHWVLAPVRVRLPNNVTMELKAIPEGSFNMGSPNNELGRNDEENQHTVTISELFYMGTYEVKQSEYQAIMGIDDSNNINSNCPVENVSWENAKRFCNELNRQIASDSIPEGYYFDLPTEAQWEYACRAETTTSLNNGTNITNAEGTCLNLHRLGWYATNHTENNSTPKRTTNIVGSAIGGPNAWGLYDMHGNVSEWCRDLYRVDYYTTCGNCTDPKGPSKDQNSGYNYYVNRGGSYLSAPKDCRSAARSYSTKSVGGISIGFRVALVPIED